MSIPEYRELLKKYEKNKKYNNQVASYGDLFFDSHGEMNRFCRLKLLEKIGEITDLERQIEIIFRSGVKYIADFFYIRNGKKIIEDFKGHPTPGYRIKRRLVIDEILKTGKIDIFRESYETSEIIDFFMMNGKVKKKVCF